MVSSSPVADGIRRLCLQNSVLLCEPTHLPLPVLLRAASKPTADMYLRAALLQEMIRLGERACLAMQDRWRIHNSDELRFQPLLWSRGEIEDLLWLQQELSEDVIELYDRHRPGRLERRASKLHHRLRVATYA